MIKIPAVDGTYELECDSNGTYHEIVAKLVGTFAAEASVSILRLGSSQVELLSSLPVYSYAAANTAKAHVKVG